MLRHFNIKNIFTALLTMLCGQLYTSCTDDNAEIPSWAGQEGSVTVNICLPEPVVVSPAARGATDFDKIDNIQVVVAEGDTDESKIIAYYTKPENPADYTGTDVSYTENSVHFSKNLSYGSKTIYVIANYERSLQQAQIGTVKALKALTQTPAILPGIPIATTSIMVAKATLQSGNHSHDKGITMEAKLQRRVAMITVEIDGTNLKDNVIVTPRKISLFRVPESCSIGANRIWTADEVIEQGESKEVEWGTVVGQYSDHGQQNKAGGHYADDYNLSTVVPLFMFENYHGGDEFGHSNSNEQTKRPQACEAITPDGIREHESTQTCSYLEVETYYVYMNDTGINSEYSGIAKFRLFLGADITRNFDVLGNHYYKVTLKLSGVAVQEGGQVDENGGFTLTPDGSETWRVETNLNEISIANNEININGSAEFLPIKVEGQNLDKISLHLKEGSEQYVYFAQGGADSGNWELVLFASEGGNHNPNAGKSDGTIWLYVPPMLDASQFGEETERVAEIEVRDRNGSTLYTTIKIVQHLPIEATMSATEFPYIKDVFGQEEMTIYIDRIDRTALPWGFDGHQLEENQNDGFENTFHLINQSGSTTCGVTHLEFAQKYLPFGTGVTDLNGEVTSDQRSAMIYALMLYENQRPDGPPKETIGVTIGKTEFPEKDPTGDGNVVRYWSIPSIAGWQMVEKLSNAGKLDSDHPIIPYLRYWTSNAVTSVSTGDVQVDGVSNDGSQFAYTYQFGWGLDKLKETDTYPIKQVAWRTQPLRFRLISVQPANLPVE